MTIGRSSSFSAPAAALTTCASGVFRCLAEKSSAPSGRNSEAVSDAPETRPPGLLRRSMTRSARHALLPQLLQNRGGLRRRMAVEAVDPEVTDIAADQVCGFDRRRTDDDLFTPDRNVPAVVAAVRHDLEPDAAAGGSAQKFRALLERQRLDQFVVDAHNAVARNEPGLRGGGIRHGHGDHQRRILPRLDQLDADPGMLAGPGDFVGLVDGRRFVAGIGIEFAHHSPERGGQQLFISGAVRVDVVLVQELHGSGQQRGLFIGRSRVDRFRRRRRLRSGASGKDGQQAQRRQQSDFHCDISPLSGNIAFFTTISSLINGVLRIIL